MSSGLLDDGHWRFPGFKQRVTTKQLKTILLEDPEPFFVRGQGCVLKHKRLGAGVHEVWMVVRDYAKGMHNA
jgi:hypothetical protein